MSNFRIAPFLCVAFLLSFPVQGAQSVELGRTWVWLDAQGNELPFQDLETIERLLEKGRILSEEPIPEGVTKPIKLTIQHEGVVVHATFRTVDVRSDSGPGLGGKPRLRFRDCYIFECAAYELDKLLGMNRVPPAVKRKYKRKTGSIQLWVESAMTEKHRLEQDLKPPNTWKWTMEMQLMRIFDNLIFNDDRNQGNVLFDANWDLLLIDHTRAFRIQTELQSKDKIVYCERAFWNQLKTIEDSEIRRHLSKYLSNMEVGALLARRKKLVAHIQGLIDERGERDVLFTLR